MTIPQLPAPFWNAKIRLFSIFSISVLLVFGLPVGLFSQAIFTAEMAVETALKNSLGLEIFRNQVAAARLADTRGLAGMTPDINLTASDNGTLNFTKQNFQNGNEINRNGAFANRLNAGVLLNWTLFDGQRMVSTKARFGRLTELEELRLRAAATDLTALILTQYWRIWQDKAQIQALDELIRSTEERRRLAQTRLELGLSSKQDLLQAELDLNTFQANRLRQMSLVSQGKIRLAQAMNDGSKTDFQVAEKLEMTALPLLNEEVLEINPALLFFRKQLEINSLEQTELAAADRPRLAATAGYNFLRSDDPANFLTQNMTHGPTVGLQFSMPIYDGGRTDSRVAVAKMQAKNIDLNRQNLERQFEADLKLAFSEHEFQQKAVELESENLKLATENLTISMERLRLGQTTSLEIRTAQLLFENAAARRNQALFAMKVAEIRVRQLASMF